MSLMLQEIHEQPDALERTIVAEREKVTRIGDFIRQSDIDLIVLVARGSSDNASLFGRYLLEVTTGIPVSLSAPSVFTLYGAKLRLKRALVIGVSQSGEGTDINLVLDRAKEAGAFTLAITNEPESTMAKIAHEALVIHAGREKSVAATKTYTGQMLYFYMLASAIGDMRLDFHRIPELARGALGLEDEVKAHVERYAFMDQCVVVGRGMNYGNSYELALKLMETCYVVAERFSSADFFHGPLAIVERRFPVIMFGPTGVTRQSNLELLGRLSELHADSLAITNDAEIAKQSSRSLLVPGEMDEFLTPIPFIVPAQLFAAHLSAAKGIDPDAPRSLAKVTKTL
ncbi:MAG: SIS domain-containing protein [Pyrinomonadaceae bacterium]|nr:SIS domain-containing protein [Pyrinomonadaceae bacterium]